MSNPHKGRTGLDRIIHAAGYSWAGLKAAYTGESAFRQETWLCVLAAPLTFWLAQTWEQAALLLGSLLLVLIVELLNSAIEAVVDRVGLENHRLAKRAKDIGSAAVLVTLLLVAVVWSTVLVGMA